MKKVFLSLLAIASLTFTSCDNDDAAIPTDNGGNQSTIDSNDFRGSITTTVTLNPALFYNLTGALVVEEGAELIIPAGTRILATGGTSAYIAISQGAKIQVNGTSSNPVVMTSGKTTQAPGDWGGLVICGRAPINSGTTAQAEVSDLTYGGTDTADNSGSISYLRLEFTGATFNSSKEFNGLSLFGVGSGTTIDYVQMHQGNDDGIEFFGGNVTANHLVVTHSTDDAFDWTEGWQGSGSNWFAKLDEGRGHRGIEADNNSNDNAATPFSNPTISNVSIVGNGDGTEDDGLKIRVGTRGDFSNIYIDGRNEAIEIDDAQTVTNLNDNTLTFSDINFANCTKEFDIDGIDYNTLEEAKIAYPNATMTKNINSIGAGNGSVAPSWTSGWTIDL